MWPNHKVSSLFLTTKVGSSPCHCVDFGEAAPSAKDAIGRDNGTVIITIIIIARGYPLHLPDGTVLMTHAQPTAYATQVNQGEKSNTKPLVSNRPRPYILFLYKGNMNNKGRFGTSRHSLS